MLCQNRSEGTGVDGHGRNSLQKQGLHHGLISSSVTLSTTRFRTPCPAAPGLCAQRLRPVVHSVQINGLRAVAALAAEQLHSVGDVNRAFGVARRLRLPQGYAVDQKMAADDHAAGGRKAGHADRHIRRAQHVQKGVCFTAQIAAQRAVNPLA